jgi:Predicted transcriptional regulator
MRIFIEGENYSIDLLKQTFGEKFYISQGAFGIIDHVGYFHSSNNEVIYLLPKIFIDSSGMLFGKYNKDDFSKNDINKQIESYDDLNWLKRFLIIFYKSIIEYRRRLGATSITVEGHFHQLNTSLGNNEFTFLDLVLSILNFYKKNSNTILYIHKEHISLKHEKVNWTKTVVKSTPLFTDEQIPIYIQVSNKKKLINTEEELLCLFYSVLFHLKSEYNLPIKVDIAFEIYKQRNFNNLCIKAPIILKKIRNRYFSDVLVKMYKLLEIFFCKYQTSSYNKAKEEFIMVNNYHIVFEDMIDKLFSDNITDIETERKISLKALKDQKDGKIIDHIFEYESIIDRDENIFYIGDSKYYKTNNAIGNHSIYKQFTYAKNVIQFNIDLLNENKQINSKIRYRDDLTEGYNITPNFFIQGKLFNDFNYNEHRMQVDIEKGENGVESSYHFSNRIFDRDTLFVHYYSINFLFVLNNYTKTNTSETMQFREITKREFRKNLVNYLKDDSSVLFYIKKFSTVDELEGFVTREFKKIIGKVYRTKSKENELIMGIYKHSDCEDEITEEFIKINRFDLLVLNPYRDNDIVPVIDEIEVILPKVDEDKQYREYLPVFSLKAVATAFGNEEHVEQFGWMKVDVPIKLNKDMFIAQVVGKSMEPTIPDGSYCIFRFERGGSRNGLVVLVESRLVSDPEFYQRYTIKRYNSKKEISDEGTWRHTKIILSPDNKDFEDLILENVSDEDFRVVAEFVCVL